jgi:hypothetical protein
MRALRHRRSQQFESATLFKGICASDHDRFPAERLPKIIEVSLLGLVLPVQKIAPTPLAFLYQADTPQLLQQALDASEI